MYQQNVTTKTMRNITRRPAPYEGKRYNNFTIFLYVTFQGKTMTATLSVKNSAITLKNSAKERFSFQALYRLALKK